MFHGTINFMGSIRGGTHFLYHVLVVKGINVGHERFGLHGTVSGFYFIDAEDYACPHRHEDLTRINISHRGWLMRHPLTAAPSIGNFVNRRINAIKWYENELGVQVDWDDPVLSGLRIWEFTHRMIAQYGDSIDMFLYLDDLDLYWPYVADQLSITTNWPDVDKSPSREEDKLPVPSWEELYKKDSNLCDRSIELLYTFHSMAKSEYGL